MKKGKKFNLAAGIIDIVFGCIVILASFYLMFAVTLLAAIFSGGGESSEIYNAINSMGALIGVIVLVAGAIYLGFGIASCVLCNKERTKYYKKKTAFLVFAIIESVLLILSVVSIFTENSTSDSSSVATIIIYLIMAVIIALRWAGFGLMTKGSKEQVDQPLQPNEETTEEPKPEITDKTVNQLQKLNELKQNGAISDQEYQEMKNNLSNK